MQPLDEQTRKKVYDELADIMITALERQEIVLTESQRSAKYILDHLDAAKTHDELMVFLQTLGEKWKMYNSEYVRLKGEKTQSADETKIKEIQSKLSQLVN